MKLKDNSTQEIDTALYQLEQKLKSNIRLTDVENSNASTAKINAVDKKLTEEIKDRQSADEKLQDNINKEIADRTAADAAIENAKQDKLIAGDNIQIDGNVISAISKEYTAEAPLKVTDGKISLDTVPVNKGGTGVTTQADINKAFIGNLEVGNSDVTDGTEFVSSYASDSGFSSTDEGSLHTPYKRQFIKVWNYIKGKISSVLGLTASSYGGTANYAKDMYLQVIDLSAQSSSNFYPLFFYTESAFAEVAIHSPSAPGSVAYNQNRIHFEISTHGWNDMRYNLNVSEYSCWQSDEITIGCIGIGYSNGGWAIWLRGGMNYRCYTRNATPSLKTADYTFDNEIYTVGTNYYGGTNTNVNIIFTPQSTITEGSYSARPIKAPTFIGNLTGDVTGSSGSCTGKSAQSGFLTNYSSTRLTSLNIVPKDASEYGGMRKDVVTSSVTDGSYPGQDGHLLTMFWDNTGRWDSQLFVSVENPLTVKARFKDDIAEYGPWVDVITSNNIGSQTVAKASTAGTANVANALSSHGGITNTDTFQNVMNNDGKWNITDLNSGWSGSLYSFHAGGSQSGLMFRIRGGSTDIRNVEVNYSIDSNKFAGPWTPLIGRIPTSAPSSPQNGDIWIS